MNSFHPSSVVSRRTAWACALLSITLAQCKCQVPPAQSRPATSNGPLVDSPPSDLVARGMVVEQPKDGDAVTGAWVTVSGWVDPTLVQSVIILGAPVDGFYEPTGHTGVPTVGVTMRKDGRFFAPRVPLQDGANSVLVIPVALGGATFQPTTLHVTALDAQSVPATLVANPVQPEPGQPTTLRAATEQSANLTWQWDLDGDGVFDEEDTQSTHTFASAGRVDVTARTRVNDQWVAAHATLTVARVPDATASTTQVNQPTRVFVLSRYATPPLTVDDHGNLDATVTAPRFVAVVDGNDVKVFDAALHLLFTLPGLLTPSHVAVDDVGNLYVADTGHGRVVRFTSGGTLDATFAQQGAYTGTTDQPLTRPVFVAVGPGTATVMLEDGTELHCAALGVGMESDTPLGNWDTVECDANALSDQTGYGLWGQATPAHFVTRPQLLFHDGAAQPALMVAGGKPVVVEGGAFQVLARRTTVVDVALGPSVFRGDAVDVDDHGKVHTFAQGQKTGEYTLPYAVTAVGAGANGVIYVAGAGHLEARSFEALR